MLKKLLSKEELIEAKDEFLKSIGATLDDVIEKEGGVKDSEELNSICVAMKGNLFTLLREATALNKKKLVAAALNNNYGKPFLGATCLKVCFLFGLFHEFN